MGEVENGGGENGGGAKWGDDGQTPVQTTQNPWFSAKKHGQTPTQTTQNIWFSTKSHGQPPTQTTHSAKSHFQNRKVTLRGYVTTRSRGTLVCTAQRLEVPPPGYAPTTHIRNISAELRRLNSVVLARLSVLVCRGTILQGVCGYRAAQCTTGTEPALPALRPLQDPYQALESNQFPEFLTVFGPRSNR